MPSSSRTSLSALIRSHQAELDAIKELIGKPVNKKPDLKTEEISEPTQEDSTQDEVLEVVGLLNQKVNDATEPAQAIINSLAVTPDMEKAATTTKRRTRKKASTTVTKTVKAKPRTAKAATKSSKSASKTAKTATKASKVSAKTTTSSSKTKSASRRATSKTIRAAKKD